MRLFDRAVVRVLPAVPRSVVRRVAAPYIAGRRSRTRAASSPSERRGHAGDGRRARRGGHEAEEAEAIARRLPRRARRDRGRRARRERLASSSTALGLKVDGALCRSPSSRSSRDAAAAASSSGSTWRTRRTTDDTLALYRGSARTGYENVGIVLQARSAADARRHRALAAPAERAALQGHLRRAARRSPSTSSEGPRELRGVPRRAARRRAAGSRSRRTTSGCSSEALERVGGARRDAYEFQMLLGVRAERGGELVAAGHPLRDLRAVRRRAGTSTRCGGCRRTRRSRATSRRTCSAGSSPPCRLRPQQPLGVRPSRGGGSPRSRSARGSGLREGQAASGICPP